MVATGPRVDVVEDHSTFFWCYAFLADSSYTFSEQVSSYYSKGFGSSDDLSSLFLILWKFFPKNVCNVRHCPIGVTTKTSMTKSTMVGTLTSVGYVARLGYGNPSVKGSS